MDVAEMTLDSYLDEWLALARRQVQPTTWQGYLNVCRAYLRPRLGDGRVGDLTVRQLNLHFVDLLTHGGRRGGPLKHRTIKGAHMVLRKALGDAVREGRLHDNVASRVTLPKFDPDRDLEPDSVRTWDAAQAARFLTLTADIRCTMFGGPHSPPACDGASSSACAGRMSTLRSRNCGSSPASPTSTATTSSSPPRPAAAGS